MKTQLEIKISNYFKTNVSNNNSIITSIANYYINKQKAYLVSCNY